MRAPGGDRTILRSVATAVIGVLLCVAAAGCTAPPAELHEASPSRTSTSAPVSPESVQQVSVMPGTSDDAFTGAVADVSTTACEGEEGVWRVEGTVTNAGAEPATYRIYVSFVRTSEPSTLALLQVDVARVEPSAQADWEGQVDLGQGDLASSGLDCVLRVERVPLDP